ncbi:hypothetical protein J3R83DRAFT_5800 [Lanmaoa asiatica]|nr:hypothetical protein J3R83DRAFT_5800 [Lanmaoa asiatica]
MPPLGGGERTTRVDAKQPSEDPNEMESMCCLAVRKVRVRHECMTVRNAYLEIRFAIPPSSTAFSSTSSPVSSVMDTMPPARWIPAPIATREPSSKSSEVERRMQRPAQTRTCSHSFGFCTVFCLCLCISCGVLLSKLKQYRDARRMGLAERRVFL